ncbi:hypothetical protein Tsubulata_029210 [Turnera subulata]|uniref:Translation elongation factor P/YeiP central domain-containing protein n=1 Tax=Turnera subulata TaxID=218843 RepID=A0A9Q0GFY8_9ROSI|nr:hypothetical protein Tsubulata_029210 [Turnera subulata]
MRGLQLQQLLIKKKAHTQLNLVSRLVFSSWSLLPSSSSSSSSSSAAAAYTTTTAATLTPSSSSSSHLLSSSPVRQCHNPFSLASSSNPWLAAIQLRGLKVNASELREGNFIEKSGKTFEVVKAEHKQKGRGGAMINVELRDVDSGNKQNFRFGTQESVEKVFVEDKTYTCLYTERGTVYLMDFEKFEELEVPQELFGKDAVYLQEQMKVKLQVYDGRPLSGSVPKHVTCCIKEMQINLKGATVTPRYTKALLDNGLTVEVPGYLEPGERVVVDTKDGKYHRRAD